MSRRNILVFVLLGLLCVLFPVAFVWSIYDASPQIIICKSPPLSRENSDDNFSMPFGVTAWSYPLNESFGLAESGNMDQLS